MQDISKSIILGIISILQMTTAVLAEIVPDKTLGSENSVVVKDGPRKVKIKGGARRKKILFHSFSKFNIKKNNSAYFESPPKVKAIISRVTGRDISKIYGTLGVNGNAHLFLINPNGIIFGKDASLDTSGSFTATTASSVEFENYSYSSKKPKSVPILDIKAPIGLSFNSTPSKIVVRGEGHFVTQAGNIKDDIDGAGESESGLKVNEGKTISLIAGDLHIRGGLITAPSGSINLMAVNSGRLLTKGFEFTKLDRSDIDSYGNIYFSKRGLVDASGKGGGTIEIVGNDIRFSEASLAIISNEGTNSGGVISVTANNSLLIKGPTRDTEDLPFSRIFARGIISQTYDNKGASIVINAGNLRLSESSAIITSTFGSGRGGDIDIFADKAFIGGGSKFGESLVGSQLLTTTQNDGRAGNISFTGESLRISDGGFFVSATFSNGIGGKIDIDSEEIVVNGGIGVPEEGTFIPSSIASVNTSSGTAGSVNIKGGSVLVKNGGRIDTSTFASGSAGSLNITAEKLEVIGGANKGLKPTNPSTVGSSGNELSSFFESILLIDEDLTGNAGDLTIRSKELLVKDGARVSVFNEGTGQAGKLKIETRKLELDSGSISAANSGGGGGIIDIESDSILLLNSEIRASAQNDGDGGNIKISASSIVGDKHSFITANSSGGFGGRVQLSADSLIFPDGNITATSSLGKTFDGSVQINSDDYSFDNQFLGELLPLNVSPVPTCNPLEEQYVPLSETKSYKIYQPSDSPLDDFHVQNNTQYYFDIHTQKRMPLPAQVVAWIDFGNGTARGLSKEDLIQMNRSKDNPEKSKTCYPY